MTEGEWGAFVYSFYLPKKRMEKQPTSRGNWEQELGRKKARQRAASGEKTKWKRGRNNSRGPEASVVTNHAEGTRGKGMRGAHLSQDIVDVGHAQEHAGALVVLLQDLHEARVVERAVVLQQHLRTARDGA